MLKIASSVSVVLVTLALSSSAFAKAETWYWGFGLGLAFPTYPAAVQTQVDILNATAGVSHSALALDLGFYWPVAPGTLIGPSITGLNDNWRAGTSELMLTHTGLYFSANHTFGADPLEGFFVRGDIGLARLALTSGALTARSESGLGLNGGVGYGFALSDETRLVLQGIYSFRRIEGETYSAFSILIGPTF